MVLHLVKLCVGCATIDELESWQRSRLRKLEAIAAPAELVHVTRQTPRREGFGPGASLYWVIGGFIRARQVISKLRVMRGEDGVTRCGLLLEPCLVATEPRPRRPFQGWRYLDGAEAPADLETRSRLTELAMPAGMRVELADLRLI